MDEQHEHCPGIDHRRGSLIVATSIGMIDRAAAALSDSAVISQAATMASIGTCVVAMLSTLYDVAGEGPLH